MRQWTEKERKKQACVARRSKPWKNSTGPKTAQGKEKSKMNAFQTGHYAMNYKIIRHALLLNRAFVAHMLAWGEVTQRHENLLRERSEKGALKREKKQ
jgi:hypothetical protein